MKIENSLPWIYCKRIKGKTACLIKLIIKIDGSMKGRKRWLGESYLPQSKLYSALAPTRKSWIKDIQKGAKKLLHLLSTYFWFWLGHDFMIKYKVLPPDRELKFLLPSSLAKCV
jgi:hypothetical protein